ncbi:MAG: type IV secretion system protein DotC [Coxiella sp. RIFCSPHIGHO2_12_FULL_42_15]|nr:MAG: type IV secretion system protein DotC [Coxiella sp. RIFCSPHIGHO2_12_FULL_42_15]
MKKLIILISTFAFSLSVLTLPGCAKKVSSVSANAGFVDVNTLPKTNEEINNIRLTALREGATSLGARGALAWRSVHINRALEQEAPYLDHVFDFNQLLLNSNVLPPILIESNDNLTLGNNNVYRSANKVYKILSPARFVTAPPTWRTYLWMPFKKPSLPNKSLLPTSRAEALVWDEYLENGWKQGLQQANDIFSTNLNRLKRDYLGMILYRKLLAQKMISAPSVATADLGITGNDKEMRINDEITRITSHSALQLNSNEWKPVMTK